MQIWNPQPTRRPDPTTCTLPPQSPTHLASFASFFGGVQPNQVVQVELRHQRLGCWPLQGQHALRRRRQRLGALRLARGTPLGLERRRRLRACRGAGRAPVSGPVRRGEGDLARVHGTSPTSVTAARTERKRAQSRKRLSILYGACARLPSRLPPPSSPPLAVARARMSRLAQRCARRAGGAPKDAGSAGASSIVHVCVWVRSRGAGAAPGCTMGKNTRTEAQRDHISPPWWCATASGRLHAGPGALGLPAADEAALRTGRRRCSSRGAPPHLLRAAWRTARAARREAVPRSVMAPTARARAQGRIRLRKPAKQPGEAFSACWPTRYRRRGAGRPREQLS